MPHTRFATPRAGALALALALAACRTTPTAKPAPARPGPVRLQLPPTLTALGANAVVPEPSSVTPADGAPFTIAAATRIVVPADTAAARVGEMLATLLRPSTGFAIPVSTANGAVAAGSIVLRLDGAADLGDEGYELSIAADSVRLNARTAAGLFHAVQTLRQLLPAGVEAEQFAMRMADAWSVPAGRIVDRPRFAWRGGMLDVARHFFTVDEVKQYLDILALYKLNRAHLHLSDDQGWRIQIDSWPKLTEVGSRTEVGGAAAGFYTKADFAEIVRYAADRFITVVPEIDMPGHIHAAIASYPELGCSRPVPGSDRDSTAASRPYTGISVGWSTLCPDKEVTYRFVDDVVREIAAMTPGAWFHIGGDEVAALADSQYTGFVERVQDIVLAHGKTPVGWEEIGKARLRPTTIAQQWRGDTLVLAARQGAKLILSPGPKAYVDMKYTPATELGLRWAGFIEVQTSYDWDPATYFRGVPADAVLGVEAPLWSETVQNITAAEYLLLPRLPAIAEVGWSAQGSRSWESFRTRIAAHAPRWRLMGLNYYPSPQVAW